jgi:hypothetical protein
LFTLDQNRCGKSSLRCCEAKYSGVISIIIVQFVPLGLLAQRHFYFLTTPRKVNSFMPTGTAFDSLNTYAAPATGGNLADQSAQQNISAAGDIGSLTTLLQNINNTNNTNRVYGGAALGQQSSQNISNELAGVLTNPQVASDQMTGAERGASGGFGVDSANTNAAVMRAMNLQSEQLQAQGQQDLTSAYNRAAPLVDASQFAMTPALLEQQQQAQAQNTLQAQAQAAQQSQYQQSLASQQAQYTQGQAQQLGEYTQSQAQQQSQYSQTLQQNKDALAQQMGLSYAQMSQSQQQFIDSQAQQMTEWGGSLQAQVTQANQANALAIEKQQAQEQQYAQSQAQQLSEFGTTSGQNAAQLYAQTYKTLPGYNQYGQYTGQTGTTGTSTATNPTATNPNWNSTYHSGFSPGAF